MKGGGPLMQKAMSTYVFVKERLHPGLLDALVRGVLRPLRYLPPASIWIMPTVNSTSAR